MMNPFAPHTSLPALSIISAMITPAILILASGSLVASTLTRLARIVDRARTLLDRFEDSLDRKDAFAAENYSTLLQIYRRRTTYAERALSTFYAAIVFFIASSLAIALDNLLRDIVPWLPVALTVAGVVGLLIGTVSLVFETNMATGILHHEIDMVQRRHEAEMVQRRQEATLK